MLNLLPITCLILIGNGSGRKDGNMTMGVLTRMVAHHINPCVTSNAQVQALGPPFLDSWSGAADRTIELHSVVKKIKGDGTKVGRRRFVNPVPVEIKIIGEHTYTTYSALKVYDTKST
jgi:hypothetical protein